MNTKAGMIALAAPLILLTACDVSPPEGAPPLIEAAADDWADRAVESEYQDLRLVRVADGLQQPWALAFLPDGRMLVSERAGRLNLLTDDGSVTRIEGVPEVVAQNQGGLLDLALHPDYEDNGWIYMTYSEGDADSTSTVLARARLEQDSLVEVERLFEQDRRSEPGRHYGSRLAFLPDSTLLMTIGDRGVEPERAQDLADHAGSILRLNDDGSVPEDNPFVGSDEALPEIWSYGHRNIQSMIVDPDSGEIWVVEHGPRGGDEVNLIQRGENYGWPRVTLGRDYDTEAQFGDSVRSHEDMVDPIVDLTPGIAPSGLALVTADHFPAWQGNLLAGGLLTEELRRLVIEDGVVVHQETVARGEIGRIRDVRQGPDGFIYLLNDETEGGVYRLEPA
jgi:glucose/arabinose dehydrogenase